MNLTGSQHLPPVRSVLAVCAHPDDESFGLGAVLDRFAAEGAKVAVLCFTCGEASTLGAGDAQLEVALGEVRRAELTCAADALGVSRVQLLDHPDGALASESLDDLAAEVTRLAQEVEADVLLVFDEGGVTGHPDHCRATEAAMAGAPALPALAWAIPHRVAESLNEEFGTRFVGRPPEEIDVVLQVDREPQARAVACHVSQCVDNPVLERRLSLLGDAEWLRWLRPPPRQAQGNRHLRRPVTPTA